MTTETLVPDGISSTNDYALYLWETETEWYKNLVEFAEQGKTWGLHAYLSLDIQLNSGLAICGMCSTFAHSYTATWYASELGDVQDRDNWTACKSCMKIRLHHQMFGWSMASYLASRYNTNDIIPDILLEESTVSRADCVACGDLLPEDQDQVPPRWRVTTAYDKYYEQQVVHIHDTATCNDCKEQFIVMNYGNRTPANAIHMNITNLDGALICDRCWEQHDTSNYEVCERCSCWTHETRWSDARDSSLCTNCYDNYIDCDDCGYDYHEDDGHTCEDEYDGESDGNGWISNYSYKPKPIFHGEAPYHMGIELEVEDKQQSGRGDMAEIISNKLGTDVVYHKWDGSLSNGFEIVTHPLSLDYYHNMDWSWLEDLKDNGFRSWNTRTCGLHVHISRTAFRGSSTLTGEAHQLRFLKFIYDNQRQACRIAGRVSEWAKWDDKGNLVAKVKKGINSAGHYSAVNTENSFTIEIRIFKGSLRKERILSAIEFTHAVTEFTRSLKIVPKDKPLSWSRFVAYVVSESNTYPNLLTIINETFDREEASTSVED